MNFVRISVYKLQEKGEHCPGAWPSHLGNMLVCFQRYVGRWYHVSGSYIIL